VTPEAFRDVQALSQLSGPVSPTTFGGAQGSAGLPGVPAEEFAGIAGVLRLPAPVSPAAFIGAQGSAALTPSPEMFTGIQGTDRLPMDDLQQLSGAVGAGSLPQPVSPARFRGVLGGSHLPVPVTPEFFAGVRGLVALPDAMAPYRFEGVIGGEELQLRFPGGGRLFLGYGMGVPLGAEKPVLTPTVRQQPDQAGSEAEPEEPGRTTEPAGPAR
jgi:hypothetical protein